MSFIGDIFGGNDAADASRDAASLQARSADKAIAFQRDALNKIRSDLQPFKGQGQLALIGGDRPDEPSLKNLITNPAAQGRFVGDNPFYRHLARDAERRVFSNAAARGKLGSGDTPRALQNALMLLGTDLVNQNITQRQNLANMGANAAAMQGQGTQTAASNISNLITGQGNALAAGEVGAANAQQQATNTGLNTILSGAGLLLGGGLF